MTSMRSLLGLSWIVVPAWIWLTRGGVLLAGNPAYAVLVTVASLVGVLLLVTGLRARPSRPRPAWRRRLVAGLAVVATVLVLGALIWLRPFAADEAAVAAMAGTSQVRVTSSPTHITLTPTTAPAQTGLVFQPGARVDPRAYVPLLIEVSASGVLVVIVKQPLNIAFTAVGAPGEVMAEHPEVETWAVGGHSLGGVAASSYAGDHADLVDALVLWASYPAGSLADQAELRVLSVSGTRDGLTTPAKIAASRADLPASTSFVAVDGAVHSYFGDYGEQPGDGVPTTTRAQAQDQIVGASVDFLGALSPAVLP